MWLIEISSFKLFCCKLDSHKMFCCKKFCHKNVVRKAKKFPVWERKKLRAGRGRWPCRAPPRRTRRWAAWPLAAPPPPMVAAAAVGARPRGGADRRGFVRAFLPFFLPFFFAFFLPFLKILFCICLFFCVFCIPCFGLAPFLPFLKKNLLFRFCVIAFDFFLKFSSHALVLLFLLFFSSCCLVFVLPFFEERSSSDSNPP